MTSDHQHRRRPNVHGELNLLTASEVADLLKVKLTWLYDEVQAGRFPVVRLGRQLRFRASDIAEYLDERYQEARQQRLSARASHRSTSGRGR